MTDDELAEAVVDGLSGIFETGYVCSACWLGEDGKPTTFLLLGEAGKPIWCPACGLIYPRHIATAKGLVEAYSR